jgi:hypothetical protein
MCVTVIMNAAFMRYAMFTEAGQAMTKFRAINEAEFNCVMLLLSLVVPIVDQLIKLAFRIKGRSRCRSLFNRLQSPAVSKQRERGIFELESFLVSCFETPPATPSSRTRISITFSWGLRPQTPAPRGGRK